MELSGPDNFYVNTFLCIIGSLQSELTRRKEAYEVINERFDFLSCPKENDNIHAKCNILKQAYSMHFGDDMENEMIQFFKFAKEPLRIFLEKKSQKEEKKCEGKSKVLDVKGIHIPTAQFLLELIINGCAAQCNIPKCNDRTTVVSDITLWCCLWGKKLR